jgi:hypothetical protein
VRHWTSRHWGAAMAGGVATAVVTGLPTEMVANPWFVRMTPVLWWNRPVWLLTAVLTGLLLATYVGREQRARPESSTRRGGIGGVLGYLAIGCPVCNKLVVVALGTSGAMTWFAPLQPILAVGALVLLVVALRARLRSTDACPTTVRAALR